MKLGRTLGRVAWSLDIERPRSESYRHTRGTVAGRLATEGTSLLMDTWYTRANSMARGFAP
jgi:hypothetical protein